MTGEETQEFFKEYLRALLAGHWRSLSRVVHTVLDKGLPVPEFYDKFVRDSMYEIGCMWENDQVTIGQEHLASSLTERVLAEVFPRVVTPYQPGVKRAVISCVQGERHQLGARIVADLLEIQGWDAHFLGANTPTEALLEFVHEKDPELVALSVTRAYNVKFLEGALGELRSENPGLRVLVGGQGLWQLPEEQWPVWLREHRDDHDTFAKLLAGEEAGPSNQE